MAKGNVKVGGYENITHSASLSLCCSRRAVALRDLEIRTCMSDMHKQRWRNKQAHLLLLFLTPSRITLFTVTIILSLLRWHGLYYYIMIILYLLT